MTLTTQQFASPSEALAHYGRKGMKWGVVTEEDGSTSGGPTAKNASNTSKNQPADAMSPADQAAQRKELIKKAAIGAGVLTVAAGVGFAAYKLNQNGKLPISSLKRNTESTAAVAKILKDPTSVIHASRGKNVGFQFLATGDTPDYLNVFSKMKLESVHTGFFEKVSDGKIAAFFEDPQGRRDAAGRVIPHGVVIPRSMSDGIENLDDVTKKIWPLLKDNYDAFYEESLKPKF